MEMGVPKTFDAVATSIEMPAAAAFCLITLLGGQKEIPLLAIGLNRELNPLVKGVFKQLLLSASTLTNLLYLDENQRFSVRPKKGMACEVAGLSFGSTLSINLGV